MTTSIRDRVEARARVDVTHLPCGGRCATADPHTSRNAVAALVDDDPRVASPRALAAAYWREAWKAAQRTEMFPAWGAEPPPDQRPRCAVVPLFVELQRIWTAALFERTGLAYAWAEVHDPVPGSPEWTAQRAVAEILSDSDDRASRSVRIMAHWTTLALSGHWAALAMDRHRLAGTMHVPYLNGMVRITRRAYPHAVAYLGGPQQAALHPLPDRYIGVLPRER